MAAADTCDLAILGGGLSGGLIALAFATLRPDVSVYVVEAGARIGGNHIWSFFDSDVSEDARWLVEPLISHRWPGYDVAFPAHRRGFAQGYNAIESEQFDAAVRARVPDIVRGEVADHDVTRVTLRGGRTIAAGAVIDARGGGDLSTLDCGWQKFVGQLLTVEGGHGVALPAVMDATVEQVDGYRFVYLLPFDDARVFVEDTYYSDGPDLDVAAVRARIDAYATVRGWRVTARGREETGVLPVVIGGDFDAYWRSTGDGFAKAGVRAGLFHPLTSYSLPRAVDFALHLARQERIDGASLALASYAYARANWKAGGFYRMLSKMLFRAADPPARYRVLERFYRLSPVLIARFYAGGSTLGDRMRILAGKPPVPIGRALKALAG
ncbi:MAG: lycopene beta-cyclase CrtY [Sphingomonadaceae bacterium]|nr:lycopene beta-cyclase CrtY [Sphingomonadaceae bacterium]